MTTNDAPLNYRFYRAPGQFVLVTPSARIAKIFDYGWWKILGKVKSGKPVKPVVRYIEYREKDETE